MKLAIISLFIFFAMKLVYCYWGDYTSYYWTVGYYSGLYFLLFSILNYVRMVALTKLQRQFFTLGAAYFAVLLIVHLICFINIDLYVQLVAEVGRISIGVITLLFGLTIINYLRIKSHDSKN